MSTQPDALTVQKSTIGAEINGAILQGVLLGLYTVVYIGTLYLYLNKKSSGSRLVVGAISLLYFLYCAYVVLFWYLIQIAFVNHSDTREGLYEAIIGGSEWPVFVTGVITFAMAALGDGILIWRCFTIWDGSLRVILLPAFLLFSQVVIDVVVIILRCAEHFNSSDSQSLVLDDLFAAQSFITFATTLTSTILIAFRIYATSRQDMLEKTRKRLRKITEILLQSAAIYSLAAVAQAVALVLPETESNAIALDTASAFTSILFIFISGVVPTLLVARIAVLEYAEKGPSTNLSMPLSGLQFHKDLTGQEDLQQTESTREWRSRDTLPSKGTC